MLNEFYLYAYYYLFLILILFGLGDELTRLPPRTWHSVLFKGHNSIKSYETVFESFGLSADYQQHRAQCWPVLFRSRDVPTWNPIAHNVRLFTIPQWFHGHHVSAIVGFSTLGGVASEQVSRSGVQRGSFSWHRFCL